MKTSERYENLAEEWQAKGRPVSSLLAGYRLIALRCWTASAGARVDGVSTLLQHFMHASDGALPAGWLDAYFSEREACKACGDRYRLENLSICTACIDTYCYECQEKMPRADNGNSSCRCGLGELVG